MSSFRSLFAASVLSIALAAPVMAQVALELTAPRSTFDVGEPIDVEIALVNQGSVALAVPRLDPKYGHVRFSIALGDQTARRFGSPMLLCTRRTEAARLEPGGRAVDSARLSFGSWGSNRGWVFREPGRYTVRAELTVAEYGDAVVGSNVLALDIRLPASANARAAAARVLTQSMGELFYFGNGPDSVLASLARVPQMAPGSLQAAQAHVALATAASSRFLGRQPNAVRATSYLQSALTATARRTDVPDLRARIFSGLAQAYRMSGLTGFAVRAERLAQAALPPAAPGTIRLDRP